MISFNNKGFESMTGEPNTWSPRVSFGQLLPKRRTAKHLDDRRGISAAFQLIDLQREREAAERGAMIREKLEYEERTTHTQIERLMTQPIDPADWHRMEKEKHAKRRETNLRFKKRDMDL